MPTSILAALTGYASGVAFAAAHPIISFLAKGAVLFGTSALLAKRQKPVEAPQTTRTETFASGPARWALGRAKIGGVVMFFGEDWDVKGTERNNPRGGADDLHLVIALSEGSLDGIEAVWVGNDRFDIKTDENGIPIRREQDQLDPNADDYQEKLNLLPYELDPGVNAYFDVVGDYWRESESLESRRLDPDNEDDAEVIRKAGLGGAISVFPYLNGDDHSSNRWVSVRRYTDDLNNTHLREGGLLNNPQKPTPFSDNWSSEHRLNGIAGVHVRLRQWTKHNFDRRVFRGGTPDLSFLVRGIRITHPDPNSDTGDITQFTDNAAAVRYWWHTERRGIPTSAIDRDAFVAAYNACEQRIIPERPATWVGRDEPPKWAEDDDIWGFRKYSINGVLSAEDRPASVEEDFDRQWQGQVVEEGGRIFYYPGIDRPVHDTVSGADVLEYPEITPAPAMQQRVNAVTASMSQSAYHDYNSHALAEISDTEKRDDIDKGFHLPTDLGENRWTINPAAAYSLALINLRRARFSTTIKLRLAPGNEADPVRYIKMSPGLIYQIDFPEEGLSARRMMLIEKTIQPDFTVAATFIDSPIGMYEDSYRLPEIIPPPPYSPNRQGAAPPKPTGLEVKSVARSSSDGTTHFSITASADPHPLRKVFRLRAGDNEWETTTENSTHVFEVNVPRQVMEVTVRHIDREGVVSLPIKEIFTPDYSGLVLPTPRWKDAFYHGGTLRMAFEADEFVAGVSGVEVRYVRQDLDDTSELDRLDDGTWAITGEHLTTKPVQIIRGQEIVAEALVHRSGHYNLFARFISSVSGTEPVRGPISAAREIAIDIVVDPADVYESAPLWDVTYHNLHKWESKFGNTKGENLMLPAFDPEDSPFTPTALNSNAFTLTQADWNRVHYVAGKSAGAVKVIEDGGYTGISDRQTYYARKSSSGGVYTITLYGTEAHALAGGSTGRRNISGNGTIGNVKFAVDLDSIPFDVWNGYVANSSVSADPLARWPFGRAPGYNQTFDTSGRNPSTGLMRLADPGDSTWFLTPPVKLGSSRRVEVRAETYAFAPGTDTVSNITFGGITIHGQKYKGDTAINLLILPEAQRNIGSVVYSITGLPAGLSFDPETRGLSGTPTLSGTIGKATYTATDALGGSVSLDFDWQVQAALDRPATPTNLTLSSRTHNSLTISWDEIPDTNWYRVEYKKTNGGNLQIWGQVFDNESTITGLESSTSYSFRVIAANGAGLSQPTPFQVRSTLAEIQVPSTGPGNVRVGSVNDRAAIIRWGGVSGASEFEVRWKLATDATYPPANLRAYGSTLGQIDPLLANTTYDVQVRAVNERGKGPWSSPALSVTTTTSQAAAPTMTITTHSSGPGEKRPFLRIVTNELSGETGTEIRVRILRSAENGGDADLPPSYPPRGTGPFLYFNGVGPGGTYLVRVRKVFEPAGGIGLIRYSGWVEETITFGGVPAQPLPPRNIDNPPKPTEIQFRIYRTATATKYRVRYWKESDPDAVLQFTTNDNQVGGSFAYTLTGLEDNEKYLFTCEAGNDEGWSIPSNEGGTTLPVEYRTPSAILGLKEAPLSESSAILAWTEDDDAESYEIDGSATGVVERVGQTGITGNNFILDGLQPDSRWRLRIRGYNSRVTSGSKWGPWRSFTPFNTPPVPSETNPYPFRSIGFAASANAAEPRKIDWTATIPHAANVIGLQVRYGQHYFGSDGKVTDWTIGHENIFNVTIANDGDTYTGTFDPGYSKRLWEVNVRLLLSDGGTYDGGFTSWQHLSNQAQFRPDITQPFTTINNAFVNGRKPMTAPTPRVYQTTTNFSFAQNTPWVHIDWNPNTEDFESQDGDGGKSRNELRITYRGKLRNLPGFPYPKNASFDHRPWAATSYYHASDLTHLSRYTFAEIRSFTSLQPYYREYPVPVGAQFDVQIIRHEEGRLQVSSPVVSYTTVDPANAPEVSPDVPVMNPPTFSGEDVNFSWGPVAGAAGYELLLLEDSLYGVTPSDDEGVLEQSSQLRTWTKPNARNEHFTVKVRSWRGSGNDIKYSTYATYDYAPPSGIAGKITGIHSRVNGPDLELIWNRLPGTATDNRYEISTSTDNGVTWSGNSNIAIGPWPEGQVEHTIDDAADTDTLVRIRAYKIVGAAQVNTPSTSWTTFHYVPTPTGDDAPDDGDLNPINEAASISANGGVHLDWSSPVSDDDHPAPSRYRIQQSSTGTGPWTNYQSGISGLVDQWDVVHNPSTARWFRVRPETFDQDGEWIEIPFVPDTAVSVGSTDATGDSTYTTITASWTPTENAQEYELEYKSGTGGFGGAGGAEGTTTITGIQGGTYTIPLLDTGTHYQLRVRGDAGDSVGAWSDVVDVDTLTGVTLPAPAGVTMSALPNEVRVEWGAVATATGYQVRIDARSAGAAGYTSDVIVKNYTSDTRFAVIRRIDFGQQLAYIDLDVRVRVRALFFDSPTDGYSAYQSIRWTAPEGAVPPPDNANVVLTPNNEGANTLANPHRLIGVNGSVYLGSLPRSTQPFRVLYIQYTVGTAGAYTFGAQYTTTGGINYGSQIRLANAEGTDFAIGTADSTGFASVSANLTQGSIFIKHLIPATFIDTPTAFSLRIDGPAIETIPLDVVLSAHDVSIVEGGSNTLQCRLTKPPGKSTSITLTSVGNSDITVSPSTLQFTDSNWSANQTLTISASADADPGDDVGVIGFTLADPPIDRSALVNVLDNTVGAIVASTSITVVEEGSTALQVSLSVVPSSNVTVTPTTAHPDLSFSPATLTFTPTNYSTNQTITVRAAADDDSNNETGSITLTGAGGGYQGTTHSVSVGITDNDRVNANLIVAQSAYSVTEGGSSINSWMQLDRNPQGKRNVTLSATQGLTISPSTFEFNQFNWSAQQQFTITPPAADSNLVGAVGSITIAGDGMTYTGSVTITDPDVAAIETDPSSGGVVIEEGGSKVVRVRLSHIPTANVTVTASITADKGVTISATSLTFTATTWDTYQSITLSTTADSNRVDEFATLSLSGSGGGFGSTNKSISVQVDDSATARSVGVAGLARLFFNGLIGPDQTNGVATGQYFTYTYNPSLGLPVNQRGFEELQGEVIGSRRTRSHRTTLEFLKQSPADGLLRVRVKNVSQPQTDTSFRQGGVTSIRLFTSGSTNRSWPTDESIPLATVTPNPSSYNGTTTGVLEGTLSYTIPSSVRSGMNRYYLEIVIIDSIGQPRTSEFNPGVDVEFLEAPSDESSSSAGPSALSEAAGAVAFGTGEGTAERVNLSSETYAHVEQPSLNPAVLPTFFGEFPEACWVTGEAIDDWQLPPAGNGLPPYTITATGLPAGISFDADTRTLSGTPTDSAPIGGTATFTLTDANGNTESREMGWVIAVPTPAAWNEFDGGFGQINNPFQMACATKGNARGFYYIQGGTNAQDIADDATGARARVLWLTCPTTHGHRARLRGAKGDGYDYDLVIKVGDDFYFSDTDDDTEFLSVPGHEDGALIGIYRYESTTSATGVNNTGDPLTLEWFPEIEHLPDASSGAYAFSASAREETGGNQDGTTPGKSETDVWVLHRNTPNGSWTRSAAPLGDSWVDVGTNATEIRYEVHLKEWENRALRRFVSYHRNKEDS